MNRREILQALLSVGASPILANKIVTEAVDIFEREPPQQYPLADLDPWYLTLPAGFQYIREVCASGGEGASRPTEFKLWRGDSLLLSMGLNTMGGLTRWVAFPNDFVYVPDGQRLGVAASYDGAFMILSQEIRAERPRMMLTHGIARRFGQPYIVHTDMGSLPPTDMGRLPQEVIP